MSKEISALLPSTPEDDEPTELLLAGLFWRASTPLIAALMLQACGPEGAELKTGKTALSEGSLHCDSRGTWRPMSALNLSQPVDFVALRSHASFNHPMILQKDAAGAPCAHASDARVCEAEVRRVSVLETGPEFSHLLAVHGDTVTAFDNLEEKLMLLGQIDTPDEALLLLEHLGLPVGCAPGSSGEVTKVSVRGAGYRVTTSTFGDCVGQRISYVVDVSRDGKTSVVEKKDLGGAPCAVAGRRPPNLLAGRAACGRAGALGRYFARAARFEAASVAAFEQLAEELRVFGAPRALREAARRAAEDEVRHARATSALAERFGARPLPAQLSRTRLRSRNDVALDNAVEGCVSETYSAYLATLQARLSLHSDLGAPLAVIARDETRHAAFSWQLAGWLEARLAPGVARSIAARRGAALAQLGARSV